MTSRQMCYKIVCVKKDVWAILVLELVENIMDPNCTFCTQIKTLMHGNFFFLE